MGFVWGLHFFRRRRSECEEGNARDQAGLKHKLYDRMGILVCLLLFLSFSCSFGFKWRPTLVGRLCIPKSQFQRADTSFEHRRIFALLSSPPSSPPSPDKFNPEISVDEVVRTKGFEWGLFKAFTSKNTISAKELLKKYGVAYLVTSISLAALSYYVCYVLVKSGVDIKGLFSKVGISVTTPGQSSAGNIIDTILTFFTLTDTPDPTITLGTLAIAYVFHKAASPIRFPPTVALTPIVAGWLDKRGNK